jgi:general secretion pathway protein I
MRSVRLRRKLEGFSLLEVLAAFVILALVATGLFQLFSGALGNAAAAEAYSRAVLVAESRLAATASARPLLEATENGDEDEGRIKWETRVKAWEPPNVDPELARVSEGMVTRLYRVEVDVHFPGLAGRERTLTLATVKLAAKDPPR